MGVVLVLENAQSAFCSLIGNLQEEFPWEQRTRGIACTWFTDRKKSGIFIGFLILVIGFTPAKIKTARSGGTSNLFKAYLSNGSYPVW